MIAVGSTRRRDVWLAGALLCALTVAMHCDVIFLGRSLVLTNTFNSLDYRSLAQNYGENFVPPEEWTRRNLSRYPNIRDPAATWWQWEPGIEFLKRSFKRHEWPFWDPYVAAGSPAMANLVSGFFFPPSTFVAALNGSVHLLNAYSLLLLWGASFFTLLFVRRHHLGLIPSLGAGTIVLMSGALNQNLGSFLGHPLACLPLALYVTRLFLEHPSSLRSAGLALTFGAILLASFPPTLLAVFGFIGLYAAVAIVMGDCAGSRVGVGIRFVGVVALSVGLVGFYYGPTVALIRAVPHVAEIYRARKAGLLGMPVANLYQLLSPTAMGGVQVYLEGPFVGRGGPSIPYAGVVAIVAALLARPGETRPPRTLFIVSVAGGLAVALKIFGMPPVQWIALLPFFDQIHFAYYFGALLDFQLAFLAALGLQALLRNVVSTRRAALAAMVPLAMVGSLIWIAHDGGQLRLQGASYWIRDWVVLAAVASLSATAVVAAGRSRALTARPALAAAALLIAAACEGVYNNWYPRPKAWDVFDHPMPYIRTLQREAGLGRVLPIFEPAANCNEPFRIYSLNSLMPFNPPRVYALYRRYTGRPTEVFMSAPTEIPPEPVLDSANVSFVTIRNGFSTIVQAAQERGYVPRFDDGFLTVFQRSSEPRFYFSSEYRVLSNTLVLGALASRPTREIVLEKEPGIQATPNTPADPHVFVESYRLNSVVLDVDAPRPGLVYASESYFDGWTAHVNGAEVGIMPANYAFRAVVVPQGRSRIEFHYWPPGLSAGLALSASSLALVLGLILLSLRRRPFAPPFQLHETNE